MVIFNKAEINEERRLDIRTHRKFRGGINLITKGRQLQGNDLERVDEWLFLETAILGFFKATFNCANPFQKGYK